MSDINKVILKGRLVRDIEIKYLNNGMAVGNFSIAVNRSVKKGDQWEQQANFFDVVIYGKSAENRKQYLLKGTAVVIEGFLKHDRWEKDGQKYSKVTIVCEDLNYMSAIKNDNEGNGGYKPVESNYEQMDQAECSVGFAEDIPF